MCVCFNYKIILEYLHGFLILKPQSTSAQLLLAGATTCLCTWGRWEQSWGREGADPPMPRVGLGQLCSALHSSRRARRQRCASYCCSQSLAVPQRAAVLGYQKDGWIWGTICGILTVSRVFFFSYENTHTCICVCPRETIFSSSSMIDFGLGCFPFEQLCAPEVGITLGRIL